MRKAFVLLLWGCKSILLSYIGMDDDLAEYAKTVMSVVEEGAK